MNRACAAFLLAAGTMLAQAAPDVGKLPPETAKLKFSALPGYRIALQKCATCHSADYIQYQPPGMTLSQWTGEVGKMQHLYGASITDDDVKKVGAYLAVAYGSARPGDLPVDLKIAALPKPESRSSAPATALAAGSSVNTKALLTANNCLSCHAIDKKIVGPAYRDVARKYRADPQSVGKLEASIRNGSSGKWGAVPMPPYAQLQPAEVRALAEFVLKQ